MYPMADRIDEMNRDDLCEFVEKTFEELKHGNGACSECAYMTLVPDDGKFIRECGVLMNRNYEDCPELHGPIFY